MKLTCALVLALLLAAVQLPLLPASTSAGACDSGAGEWLRAPTSDPGPYFDGMACSLELYGGDLGCEVAKTHGRDFGAWRWKSNAGGCSLPDLRDPGGAVRRAAQGKAVLVVGDSLPRNFVAALACLMHARFPDFEPKYRDGIKDSKHFSGFSVPSINMTVDYMRSPYLVQPRGKLDQVYHDWADRVVDYDAVVLNAGHWLGKLSYSSPEGAPGDVEARGPGEAVTAIIAAVWDALRDYKGLALWKTYAYSHYNNGDWRSGKCHFEEPFHSSVASPGMDPLAWEVHTAEMAALKRTCLQPLDITTMSLLRADAHPGDAVRTWLPEARASDCSHWCLTGSMDPWLELFFLKLEAGRSRAHRRLIGKPPPAWSHHNAAQARGC